MTGFVADLDRAKFGSPDRVDALVWALTELLTQRVPFEGLLEYYRAETARARAGGKEHHSMADDRIDIVFRALGELIVGVAAPDRRT